MTKDKAPIYEVSISINDKRWFLLKRFLKRFLDYDKAWNFEKGLSNIALKTRVKRGLPDD